MSRSQALNTLKFMAALRRSSMKFKDLTKLICPKLQASTLNTFLTLILCFKPKPKQKFNH
jgi:hypothetical protein